MDIKTKISLDILTEKGVTVKEQRYIEVDGEILNVGELHAKSYTNDERGRKELKTGLSEPYLSAVLAVWGDAPTVIEDIESV